MLRTIRLSKRLDELPQKDAEQHWNEHSDEMIRMTQAGVIVADHNAIVVEMLANNADPLAAQVYAAIGLSHFESTRDLYSTMTRKSTVSG